MPNITDLPPEVVALVLRQLDKIRALPPALLASRHFYTSYLEQPRLKEDILRRQTGNALLPIAVAVELLKGHEVTQGSGQIREILETLSTDPTRLAERIHHVPLAQLSRIGQRHEVVEESMSLFAENAWSLVSSEPLVLSHHERLRFRLALYRSELLCILVRKFKGDLESLVTVQGPRIELLARHPPWENEQIACAHDFVEHRLMQAIKEPFAHDVVFGEFSYDYLSRGSFAFQTQYLLSLGLDFVHKVVHTSSYDEKLDLLKSRLDCRDANQAIPYDQLPPENDEHVHDHDDEYLGGSFDEHLEKYDPRARALIDEDLDKGPKEAWQQAHYSLRWAAWVMFAEHAERRDRAYVFWDLERVERHDLLRVFDELPNEEASRDEVMEEERKQMQRSWDERSKIWVRGGRGYWAEGDLSRIVW